MHTPAEQLFIAIYYAHLYQLSPPSLHTVNLLYQVQV